MLNQLLHEEETRSVLQDCKADMRWRGMQTEPLFKSAPTHRDYEKYRDEQHYTQGWNDAMHFIFDSDKEKWKQRMEIRDKEGNLLISGTITKLTLYTS